MKLSKKQKSYTLYMLLALVLLAGCSELAHNSEKFVVVKITKYDKKTFNYELKPVKGLGTLHINSENFYNVSDTLTLKPN
tara:strand:- start:33446 stop:33685 length:240 start_codon:yes stop_codon:yes gene_type:complete